MKIDFESLNYVNYCLKDRFTQKWRFAENVYTLRSKDVDEFVFSQEQIWRNLALHHLLTNGSPAVNGCRQHESKQLIKTSQ